MNRKSIALSIPILLMIAGAVLAQGVPALISYQGRLTDDAGAPLAGGTVDMTFAVHDSAAGSTVLWSETQTNVTLSPGGVYSVLLGAVNPVSAAVFSPSETWLSVGVDGETLTPRQRVAAVPYAFAAESVAGDKYVLTSGDTVNGDLDLNGTLRIGPAAAPFIGIQFSSTTSPDYGAFIFGTQLGVYAVYNGSTVGNTAMMATPNGAFYGIAGGLTATDLRVGGDFSATTSNTALGVSASASGYGSNASRAVMAIAHNHGSGEAAGGYFIAFDEGTGTHYGVYGRAMDDTGVHYGVYGRVSSPDGYGLYSNGNAYVDGQLAVDGVSQDLRTKKQIAMLRWYDANEKASFTTAYAGFAMAFDGLDNMYMTKSALAQYDTIAVDFGAVTPMGFSAPQRGLATTGKDMWFALPSSGMVMTQSGATVRVGNGPMGMCFDGRFLWVANSTSNNVSVVDPAARTVLTTVPAGAGPFWTACTKDKVWVTNAADGTVRRYDRNTLSPDGSFTVGGDPRGIAFDGANVWVATGTGNQVVKLRESDGLEVGRYSSGGLNAYGVVFDGAHVWVTNSNTNSIVKIRAIDGVGINLFGACATPRMPAFDGISVWVPCEGGGYQKF